MEHESQIYEFCNTSNELGPLFNESGPNNHHRFWIASCTAALVKRSCGSIWRKWPLRYCGVNWVSGRRSYGINSVSGFWGFRLARCRH